MRKNDEWEGEAPAEPLSTTQTAHREVRPPIGCHYGTKTAHREVRPPVGCRYGTQTAHREVRPPIGADPDSDNRSTGALQSQKLPSLPQRKRPCHGIRSEAGSPITVFLTVCSKDRDKWLATAECHALLVEIWTAASTWLVGRYVVMPDHVHLFAAPGEREIDLENWVKYWKSMFTKRHKAREHQWQSGYWDVRLRGSESYDEKWEYVRNNPVRHGLVERAEDWPFQGVIHTLDW